MYWNIFRSLPLAIGIRILRDSIEKNIVGRDGFVSIKNDNGNKK